MRHSSVNLRIFCDKFMRRHIHDPILPKSQTVQSMFTTECTPLLRHLKLLSSDADAPPEPCRRLWSCDASSPHLPVPSRAALGGFVVKLTHPREDAPDRLIIRTVTALDDEEPRFKFPK